MDGYLEIGNYYCATNAIASTLKNCPFNRAFTLKIEYGTGTRYQRQLFKEYDTGRMAFRSYNSSASVPSWGNYVYFSDDDTVLSNGVARSLIRVQCTANTITVINSDTASVSAGKLPEKRQTYIPVVVGHSGTNACIDNVCYDSSGGWLVYTTYSQYVSIMFFDVSKITHVETSA